MADYSTMSAVCSFVCLIKRHIYVPPLLVRLSICLFYNSVDVLKYSGTITASLSTRRSLAMFGELIC